VESFCAKRKYVSEFKKKFFNFNAYKSGSKTLVFDAAGRLMSPRSGGTSWRPPTSTSMPDS
jgi:hypothetical protein